jgi:hypothetical protein
VSGTFGFKRTLPVSGWDWARACGQRTCGNCVWACNEAARLPFHVNPAYGNPGHGDHAGCKDWSFPLNRPDALLRAMHSAPIMAPPSIFCCKQRWPSTAPGRPVIATRGKRGCLSGYPLERHAVGADCEQYCRKGVDGSSQADYIVIMGFVFVSRNRRPYPESPIVVNRQSSHSRVIRESTKMEHRKAKRRPTTLFVETHYHNQGNEKFYFCLTQDVGLDGMFLSTKGYKIPKGSDVDLVFASQTGRPKWHTIPATVVRRSKSGIGVKFRRIDQDTLRSLRQVVL